MYWAGEVVRHHGTLVIMNTKGERIREFAITFDTLWFPLPSLNG